jgi:hypothetical protein
LVVRGEVEEGRSGRRRRRGEERRGVDENGMEWTRVK